MKDLVVSVRKHKNKTLLIISLILALALCVVLILNYYFRTEIERTKVLDHVFNISSEFKYPMLKRTFIPLISAKGAVIMDADTRAVLYAKNPALRFSSASTTKIMTAITGLDYFKPEDILTVKIATREGSIIGLRIGEQMTFKNLLYAMFLASGNDAAQVVAQNYPGGEAEFVKKMNENAVKFNLFNTHFQDPAGLMDNGDYTTPLDLATLATFAIKNPVVSEIVATQYKTISDVTNSNYYYLQNRNKLLGVNGINGIKTGTTEEAGQVLVVSKNEKGNTIITVVMLSEDRFLDTLSLLDLVSDNITYLSIHP